MLLIIILALILIIIAVWAVALMIAGGVSFIVALKEIFRGFKGSKREKTPKAPKPVKIKAPRKTADQKMESMRADIDRMKAERAARKAGR